MTFVDKFSTDGLNRAADWWFDKFLRGGPKDNGDSSYIGGVAGLLHGLLAEDHPVAEEKREPFREAFRDGFQRWCNRPGNALRTFYSFGCDYHPEGILMEAMEVAGIDESRAPWKTHMYLGNDGSGFGISVSDGYGKPIKYICDPHGRDPTKRWVLQFTLVLPESKWAPYTEHPGELRYSYTLSAHQERVEGCRTESADGYSPFNRMTAQWFETLVDGKWTTRLSVPAE